MKVISHYKPPEPTDLFLLRAGEVFAFSGSFYIVLNTDDIDKSQVKIGDQALKDGVLCINTSTWKIHKYSAGLKVMKAFGNLDITEHEKPEVSTPRDVQGPYITKVGRSPFESPPWIGGPSDDVKVTLDAQNKSEEVRLVCKTPHFKTNAPELAI